ncbi:MAG: hypothetical protein ACPGRW_08500 [Flavobacteriaceae bacterium]
MDLSKEELQFIDTYLENSGVNYVDVRLELTDHIASTIESKLESTTEQTFYEIFKDYMVSYKKHLIENSEAQKAKLKNETVMKFLKSFMSLDVLFLIGVSMLLTKVSKIIKYQEYFLKINFGLFIFALISYYTMFYKTRKTSIGASLLSVVAICYYIILYIKNPFDILCLAPIMTFGYLLFEKLRNKPFKQWSVILVVVYAIVVFPLFVWFDKWSQPYVTDKLIVSYFFMQLTMWYVLFKTFMLYKLELDKKYKLLFESK